MERGDTRQNGIEEWRIPTFVFFLIFGVKWGTWQDKGASSLSEKIFFSTVKNTFYKI